MSLTKVARMLRKKDTWAERLLWRWLRDRRFSNYKFRRQHPMGSHILDFYCVEARLNIELDGSQDGTPEQCAKDARSDAWLEAQGLKVLRLWNGRLRRETDLVRQTIWRALQDRAPPPVPDYWRPLCARPQCERDTQQRGDL